MRAKKFYNLKKIKIRQSWNKYNLYNLARAPRESFSNRTYYQGKWESRSLTRAYHGETILEKHWKRMFRPAIRAVVPMDPKALAQGDGSEHGAGRGSGVRLPQSPDTKRRRALSKMPYMNNAYAIMERRLDSAIFRSMFASSSRQARQFIIHGYVKVNGKQMLFPAYQLNPGDMFQVDPERVLYATGAKKLSAAEAGEAPLQASQDTESGETPTEEEQEQHDIENAVDASEAEAAVDPKETLKGLMAQAQAILSQDKTASARRKRELREFQRLVRKTLSRKDTEPTFVGDLETQLSELTSKLSVSKETTEKKTSEEELNADPSTNEQLTLTSYEKEQLEKALAQARENPYDPSKPYATPWRPRDYMSAFAFIPRYLEVHHAICSAIYVRHPVVRPGLAEVPTPFNYETLGLAYNWYLRRR